MFLMNLIYNEYSNVMEGPSREFDRAVIGMGFNESFNLIIIEGSSSEVDICLRV